MLYLLFAIIYIYNLMLFDRSLRTKVCLLLFLLLAKIYEIMKQYI